MSYAYIGPKTATKQNAKEIRYTTNPKQYAAMYINII